MSEQLDFRLFRPEGEIDGYRYHRVAEDLASTIAASVIRALMRRHAKVMTAQAEAVGVDMRAALERELQAALKGWSKTAPAEEATRG